MISKRTFPALEASPADTINTEKMLAELCAILLRVRNETKSTAPLIVRRDQAVEWPS